MNVKPFLPAILAAICWGISYAACEYAIKDIDKKVYFLITGICTALFWFAYYFIPSNTTQNNINTNSIFWLFCSVSLGLLGNYFNVKAIESLGSIKSSAIEITYPIFCALFIMFFSRVVNISLYQFLFMLIIIVGSAGFMMYDKK